MYSIVDEQGHFRGKAKNLSLALDMAKIIDEFVTITDGKTEICGKFGVDSIENGICPDGIVYDWNKASRIGQNKKFRG